MYTQDEYPNRGQRLLPTVLLAICSICLACIVPDEDIQFEYVGHAWAVDADGAEGYEMLGGPPNNLLVDGHEPRGTICLASCNHARMEAWYLDPPDAMDPDFDTYSYFVDDGRNAALGQCILARNAANLPFSNCPAVTMNAPLFSLEESCSFSHGLDDETGGGGEYCASTINPGTNISCSTQGDCNITATMVEALLRYPKFVFDESGYGTFVTYPVQGLKLNGVASSDIVYLMGMRTNDIIKEINDQPVRTLVELRSALVNLSEETSFTVEIRRSTSNLVYTYDVV